jgi:hypothetical protein
MIELLYIIYGRQIMKKVLSVFMSVCMLLSVMTMTGALCVSAETDGDFEYTVLEGGSVSVTEYTGSATDVTITDTINGKTVTQIGEKAFFENTTLEYLVMPDTVTAIGDGAFEGCTALATVEYSGSSDDWAAISFGENNEALTCTMIFCMGDGGIIDPHTHTWGDPEAIIAGDCDNDGLDKYACTVCSITKQEVVPKGHIPVIDKRVEPTCMTPGKEEGSHCSRCGKPIVNQAAIPALGHDFDDGVVTRAATCSQEGIITYTCQREGCGETLNAQIKKTDHKRVWDERKPATCTEPGSIGGAHCEVCGAQIVEPIAIPANGHDYSIEKILDPATCVKAGTKQYTCSECGTTKTEEYTTTEHTFINATVTKEPTCTAAGVKTYTCKYCGKTKTETIPAKGHTAVTDKAVAATCTKSGLSEGSHCKVCGAVITKQKTVAAKGHTAVKDKAVAATYTATGLTEGSHCKVCGKVLKKQTKTAKKKLKKPTLKKLTAKSKAFGVKWKKVSDADGYQICYAANKTFTKNKATKKVANGSAASATVKKLKAKKKYFVRVRAYKETGGKKVYSEWSETLTVKTKK